MHRQKKILCLRLTAVPRLSIQKIEMEALPAEEVVLEEEEEEEEGQEEGMAAVGVVALAHGDVLEVAMVVAVVPVVEMTQRAVVVMLPLGRMAAAAVADLKGSKIAGVANWVVLMLVLGVLKEEKCFS